MVQKPPISSTFASLVTTVYTQVKLRLLGLMQSEFERLLIVAAFISR